MKGFKGYEPGLICRGKQYAENTVFEEKTARAKESGMHFCENPMDVLDFYGFVNKEAKFNEFTEVEALGSVSKDGTVASTTKLKIGAKLTFPAFVKACVDFVIEKTTFKLSADEENNDDNSAQIGSSGYYAQIGSSGYSAKIGSSGDSAKIECTGHDSVVCCAGGESIVKAKKGCWITLSEWKWDEEKKRSVPVCVKTEFVDGERIKEDTFYKLTNGEFVEVEQ